ncbi:lysophospholipid acyltransferase family protein [Gordonia sp. NPDC003376]
MWWYRFFKHVVIGPALWLACRPRVVGAEHIPTLGPAVLAANHSAFVDSLLLCLVSRRPVHFLAKQEYFDGAGAAGRARRWFFSAVGQIPVDRDGGDRAGAALDAAAALLADGHLWAVHPEGTRCADGAVHRGHTGAIRVAAATGAPVIPIALRGTDRVNPPGSAWWRPHRVSVVIGRPLEFAGTDVRADTDRLMGEISILAGQPYVDAYATRSRR